MSSDLVGFDGWSSEVSLDWVRVGCGVLLILIAPVFPLCRSGEADTSSSVFGHGLLFLLLPLVACVGVLPSEPGVSMQSSEIEETDSSNVLGPGLGLQPDERAPEGSRVGPGR